MQAVTQLLEEALGAPLSGRRILDVGAGQGLFHMAFFSRENDVTGIDLEVIAQGMDLRSYAHMWRANGPRRTIKTVGRKVLRIDRHYRREVERQLGLRRFPRADVLQMDATAMSFADESFEVVHSRSVLHHLPDPAQGVRELARVLRPGGVAYISLHPYTSHTGSLDPRVMRGEGGLPLWPHLRPSTEGMVLQNAFLNKLRLTEWRTLFAELMPGAHVHGLCSQDEARLRDAAARLQSEGELTAYTLDELLTGNLVVVWRKE
ncbi:MAG TPA: class I SAM-dependent methyltransferase [Solirubrobacteraceae bacterium]|nr:class I SAM-dependent methyltransferase [Solirubrobacteraceae bacterium]